jgi:hypothetical protein
VLGRLFNALLGCRRSAILRPGESRPGVSTASEDADPTRAPSAENSFRTSFLGSRTMSIRYSSVLASASTLLTLVACSSLRAQAEIGPKEARTIAVDAYVYFYPLLSMDVTREQFTNVEPGKEFGRGPMNTFVSVPAYPAADYKDVVRPNFDTLYSSAWLDLTVEPMVVSAPDTAGRYYLLPMLDMWSDVFAAPGWRTTGTAAADYLVTPPGYQGPVPKRFTHIAAPTPYVWIIGRTKTDGTADYPAVHEIQAGYRVTPLSKFGKPVEPPKVTVDPDVDMKTPPKIQVDSMPLEKYFDRATKLLAIHPPHATDQPILARMKRIGLEPGKGFDLAACSPEVATALEGVREEALALMAWKLNSLARVANGWSMNTDTMGVYGNDYLKRAIVAQVGLGANLPEDAIYPLNLVDDTDQPLDGTNAYTIHFDAAALPPVNAFWSITLYDSEGFQVANP